MENSIMDWVHRLIITINATKKVYWANITCPVTICDNRSDQLT